MSAEGAVHPVGAPVQGLRTATLPFGGRTLSRSPLLRYGAAMASAVVAMPLAVALRPYVEPNYFQIFLAAVMVSGLYGGLGPGLLTTLLTSTFTAYAFLP